MPRLASEKTKAAKAVSAEDTAEIGAGETVRPIRKRAAGKVPPIELPPPSAEQTSDVPPSVTSPAAADAIPRPAVESPSSLTPVAAPSVTELRERAFELRRERRSYREIAVMLGVAMEVAHQWVEEHWREIREICRESAQMARAAELATLDALEQRWLPLALAEELEVSTEREGRTGKPVHVELDAYEAGLKAVDRVLKIAERRAKLLGLEAAQEVTVGRKHLTLEEAEMRLGGGGGGGQPRDGSQWDG